MKYFILGIIVTLAVINPATTKNMLSASVDVVHNVVTNVLREQKVVAVVPVKAKQEATKNEEKAATE